MPPGRVDRAARDDVGRRRLVVLLCVWLGAALVAYLAQFAGLVRPLLALLLG